MDYYKADKDIQYVALFQRRCFPPVSAEQVQECRYAKIVEHGAQYEITNKEIRVGPVNIPPAIVVNAHNLAAQARDAKNKENGTYGPNKNGPLLSRLVEIGAGKVVDKGKHKIERLPDYIAIDRQLINMAVPYHGQSYTEVPQSTHEKKTAKKVVIFLSSP